LWIKVVLKGTFLKAFLGLLPTKIKARVKEIGRQQFLIGTGIYRFVILGYQMKKHGSAIRRMEKRGANRSGAEKIEQTKRTKTGGFKMHTQPKRGIANRQAVEA
jgi:hypothetical protein